MIYFIQTAGDRLIKIGYSGDAKSRIAGIKRGLSEEAYVLKVIEGDMVDEKILHSKFEHLNEHDEWFRPGEDLLDFIEDAEGIEYEYLLKSVLARMPYKSHRAMRLYCIGNGITIQDYINTLVATHLSFIATRDKEDVVMTTVCQFRIPDDKHKKLKDYCSYKDTTITTLLLDYIDTIVATKDSEPEFIQFNDDGTPMEPAKKLADPHYSS